MSTRRDSTTDKRQKNQYCLAFSEESRGANQLEQQTARFVVSPMPKNVICHAESVRYGQCRNS